MTDGAGEEHGLQYIDDVDIDEIDHEIELQYFFGRINEVTVCCNRCGYGNTVPVETEPVYYLIGWFLSNDCADEYPSSVRKMHTGKIE